MDFRKLASSELANEFVRVRNLTEKVINQFRLNLGSSLDVKLSPTVNLPRWEFSHVAWFSERWILRNKERNKGATANLKKKLKPDQHVNSFLKNADELFDSSTITHDERWKANLPTEMTIKNYLDTTLKKILLQINDENPTTDDECYFYRLALAHEYMHLEAYIMTAQTLKFPISDYHNQLINSSFENSEKLIIKIFKEPTVDSKPEFIFDNETLNFTSPLKPFEIDSRPISIKKLMQFHQNEGYENKCFWSSEGWEWLSKNKKNILINFCSKKGSDTMQLQNWFGLNHFVNSNFPAIHINYFEAEAYCNWKERRLPSELEWLVANKVTGFKWGDVWEWTSSAFTTYKNFRSHPYEEYSEPWFEGHQVVKGSSFATQSQLKNASFRNFYQKHRNDVFIGFRTAKYL